jgi:Uma2 family endonuclease
LSTEPPRLISGETDVEHLPLPEETTMSLARKLDHPATLADLEALPRTWRGEIINGSLYAFPRPRFPHSNIESSVVADLKSPFQRGRGGPGGWWILAEPGIELPGSPEVSPDLAGWRRERLPSPPKKGPITTVPDWACEILSPRTRGYDLLIKRPFYASVGVPCIWYIDPEARVVTVSKLVGGQWLEIGTYGPTDKIRAEPFEAVEYDLADWFEGLDPEEDDD